MTGNVDFIGVFCGLVIFLDTDLNDEIPEGHRLIFADFLLATPSGFACPLASCGGLKRLS